MRSVFSGRTSASFSEKSFPRFMITFLIPCFSARCNPKHSRSATTNEISAFGISPVPMQSMILCRLVPPPETKITIFFMEILPVLIQNYFFCTFGNFTDFVGVIKKIKHFFRVFCINHDDHSHAHIESSEHFHSVNIASFL